jgi:hypothetical protein
VWGNGLNTCNCVYNFWSNISDCRDKSNIKTLSPQLGIQFIRKLIPVSFHIDNRDSYVLACSYEYGYKDGNLVREKESYGFIAQDVKNILDDLNIKFDALGYDESKDAYRLTYEEFIPSIVQAIQEIDSNVQNMKKRLEILENLK